MSKHVIRMEGSTKGGYRFVGMSEKINVQEGDKFLTMKGGEFERFLGKPIEWKDGCPTNLNERDERLMGFIISMREAITLNPNLSAAAKARIIDGLKPSDFDEDAKTVAVRLIEEDAKHQTEASLHGLSPRERRAALKQLRHDKRKIRADMNREIREIHEDKDRLATMLRVYEEVEQWLEAPLVLQTPSATLFHDLRQSVIDGEAVICASLRRHEIDLNDRERPFIPINPKDFEDEWNDASVFMVEHDWARAFTGAKDYLGGEVKLPDDVCAFEFRISGRHVIAVAFDMDGRIFMQPIIKFANGWLLPEYVYYNDDNGVWQIDRSRDTGAKQKDLLQDLVKLIGEQIKAVAVALDAEVATSDIVRAPHKLNHAREKRGKLPVSSYHVVSLSRRSRAPRLDLDPGEPTYHVRLHFRRGHWRHFENHKTWVRWCLVGDPDLGFVDKHYKL